MKRLAGLLLVIASLCACSDKPQSNCPMYPYYAGRYFVTYQGSCPNPLPDGNCQMVVTVTDANDGAVVPDCTSVVNYQYMY